MEETSSELAASQATRHRPHRSNTVHTLKSCVAINSTRGPIQNWSSHGSIADDCTRLSGILLVVLNSIKSIVSCSGHLEIRRLRSCGKGVRRFGSLAEDTSE